jgi:FkbM family methyltransferase
MRSPAAPLAKHGVRAGAVAAKRVVARTLPRPVYGMYRKRRVARLIASYSPRLVTHTYGGHRLTVALADPLAEGWYDHDWPRLEEIDELVRVGGLRRGATVFDLGAHQAVVALMLAAEVGPSGRIIAVEAQPHNASIARRNVSLNRAANVAVVHAAIADRPGTVSFAEGLNGHVDAATRLGNVEVLALTIDQLAEQHGRPDLVFLDVEGYEGKALEGAEATLRARSTSFFVEVHSDDLVDWTVAEIMARFAGYSLLVAEATGTGQAARFAPFEGTPRGSRFFLVAVPEAT